MNLNNNISHSYAKPQFGLITNMDKSTRKTLVNGLKDITEMREYITLRNANQNNPHTINLEVTPSTGRLYGEIWQPNSTFINYADYQDKNTKTLDFIKSFITRSTNI